MIDRREALNQPVLSGSLPFQHETNRCTTPIIAQANSKGSSRPHLQPSAAEFVVGSGVFLFLAAGVAYCTLIGKIEELFYDFPTSHWGCGC
jgi:hypothetical protein